MQVKSTKWWLFSVLVLLLIVGCEGRSKQPAASEAAVGPDSATVSGTLRKDESGKPFTVTILPEKPRTGDDLRTLVRGASGPFVFAWERNGQPIAGQNKTRLAHQGLMHGDVVRVIVAAGTREASAQTIILNSPPEVKSVVVKTPYLCRGVDFEVEPRATDVDGDPIEFSYGWRIDEVELYGEDGPVLTGDTFHRGQTLKLEVIPRDEEEEGEPFTQGLEFEVGNAPPRIVSSPPTSIPSPDYRYQARATDADEDEITYQLTKGPEGMTIDPASGLVLWSMPADATGTFEVRIEARDAEGEGAWQEFSLEIERGGEKQ
jgi:hypothetical protein